MPELHGTTLLIGRELRKLSQSELANKSGVAQGTISKIENGLLALTPELAEKFGEVLELPVSFFEAAISNNLAQSYFRKLKIGKSELSYLSAKLIIMLEQIKRLINCINLPQDTVPDVDLEHTGLTIEDLANRVRQHWGLPSGPIKNLVSVLERAGVLIVECDFGTERVDGMSIREGGLPPIVFVNSKLSGERTRYTLAHELGHLILHCRRLVTSSPEVAELEAWQFASNFMLPRRELLASVAGTINITQLSNLKQYWRVSMQALIMRFAEIGRISDSQKKRLFMQISSLGYRKSEPNSLPREDTTILDEIFRIHFSTLGYSIQELAVFLRVNVHDLHLLYPKQIRPILRVV